MVTTFRGDARQSKSVPTEYSDDVDHRRQLARAINGLLPVAAVSPIGVPTTVSGTYTQSPSDLLLRGNATGGTFTITLMSAAGQAGRMVVIKKTDTSANVVTIDGSGSEAIDGVATRDLAGRYAAVTLISDGTNWQIAGECPGVRTFTATLTGCTTSPTGTVNYTIFGNFVLLTIPTISGTSNTTAATLTGLPAALTPATNQFTFCNVLDSGANFTGIARMDTANIISLFKDNAFGGFTASGTKGIQGVQVLHYSLF